MLNVEDDAVVADSQPPVVAASQCSDLPSKRSGVLGILLNFGDDPLSVSCGKAAHIPDRPRPPFDSHSLIHILYFLIRRTGRQEAGPRKI